jgi:hypothetical protein
LRSRSYLALLPLLCAGLTSGALGGVALGGCGASSTDPPGPASGDSPGTGASSTAGGTAGGDGNSSTAGGTSGGATAGTTAGTSAGATAGSSSGGTPPGGTPDAGARPTRFIAIGDTGKGNDGQRSVAAAMAETCRRRGCDFVVLLGDNLYPSGASSPTDRIFAEKFEDIYAPLDIPFWAVLGNHDYGANGAGTDFGRAAHEVAYTQRSKKWRMPAPYYRFTEGPVDFFALDTNAQMFRRDGDQKRDVSEWITASKAPWKIALGHHPYLSNGTHGNAGNYEQQSWIPVYSGGGVKDFAEEVYCGRVDLYFSGHDHSQQWLSDTCRGTVLVVSGAGAEATAIVVDRNAYRYQTSDLGFLYVEVEPGRLSAEFIDKNVNTQFTHVLTK